MWHWDQGHRGYFDFDVLRAISRFVTKHDFKVATRPTLLEATGLPFPAPKTHSPWRNYSRTLKLALLISEEDGEAKFTPVAERLAEPGVITCDEYFHFLAQVSTEPSPALKSWSPAGPFRYPLLVALEYLLAKAAVGAVPFATSNEIIGAYRDTGFSGSEDDAAFIAALGHDAAYHSRGKTVPAAVRRQARESLKALCQISYLHLRGDRIVINLDKADARTVFHDLSPLGDGPRANDRDAEIRRLAGLFAGGTTLDFSDYPTTVVNEVVESGFEEGTKVQKTHVTIERNGALRKAFFAANPTSVCDVCRLDTAQTYPWADRVMDLHHLLPLSSGTRVVGKSTTFDDLVALCPSCHRGVHRYYGRWFRKAKRLDFESREEAVGVYNEMKAKFPGSIHA